jgi:hypothetical protein
VVHQDAAGGRVGACAYGAAMTEQPRDAELAARAREERLADIRARTSWYRSTTRTR